MSTKLDNDLMELNKRTTTGSHEVRNKAIGEAQVLNIQSIRNLNKQIKRLQTTIVDLNAQNNLLDRKVFWLTVATFVLSVLQLVQIIEIVIKWTN